MSDKFCIEAKLDVAKCVNFESIDFPSEEQIFDILLDILKSELPPRMLNTLDCSGKPMSIAESDIDLIPPDTVNKFSLFLNPIGDTPKYNDSLLTREVKHTFELMLTVINENKYCITWELLRFKNIVEGLIVGAEFEIDGYADVYIDPEGFRYLIPDSQSGVFRRTGAYRFSVTVIQYRSN